MKTVFAARRAACHMLLSCVFLGSASWVSAQPVRDTVSDGVGATAGVFRVDESGNATYRVGIAVPPGTAGVAPTLSLEYSSQGTLGSMGKGWSLGGASAIGRCRRTREHGDFYSGGVPIDGDSLPVALATTDAFCLDGQRLIKVGTGTYGAANTVYYPELDPSTRVTSLGGNNSTDPSLYTGPTSFKVERKDGSVAEYGNTADARIERNQCAGTTGVACAVSVWALNRIEDSTGNYMTWHYTKYLAGSVTTTGTGADEYVPLEVRYTGKRVLSGQTGSATNPYARVLFGYSASTAADQQLGWLAGSRLAQTRRLDTIRVQDPYTGTPRTVRYYGLSYVASASNSKQRWLQSVQECNKGPGDTGVDSAQVCYPATTFAQSTAKFQFDRVHESNITMDVSNRRGARIGDVDGDGRMDLVWVRDVNEPGVCTTSRIFVSYGDRDTSLGTSELTINTPAQAGVCVGRELADLEDSWQLLDYDGDGRDDLMLADAASANGRWRIHRSLGDPPGSGSSVFDTANNLLGTIVIPVTVETRRLAQLIDFNGDGLLDVLYPVTVYADTGNYSVLRARLRERYLVSTDVYGLRFGPETPLNFDWNDFDSCPQQLAPGQNREELPDGYQLSRCELSFAQSNEGRFIASDFDGDGRGDLMMKVYRRYTPIDALVPPDEPEVVYISEEEVAEREREPQGVNGPQYTEHWYFFVSRANGTSTVRMQQYDMLPVYNPTGLISGDMPPDASRIQLADFNGDGLADLLYRRAEASQSQTFRLRHNQGVGFALPFWDATGIKNPDFAQVADINGDGRADLLYPPDTDNCAAESNTARSWCVRYGQAQSMTLSAVERVPVAGTSAASATLNPIDHDHYFADFDGDGAADYVRFKRANNNPKVYSTRSTTRHQARDVIAQVTDGLGAITQLTYQPLTNAAVYRRDTGGLTLAVPYGRGSPVHDMLAPVYVVSKAASSAPTWTDGAALAEITYRYAGARMQAGGRGFLGFREIATFDGAHTLSPAKHMAVRTRYRQDFPFIGHPDLTEKFAVSSAVTHGSTAINACRGDPETLAQSCFYSLGGTWPELSGTKIANSKNVWACKGKVNDGVCPIADNPLRTQCIAASESAQAFDPLGTQQPIFPYLAGSVEDGFAFNTATTGNGTKLATTISAFCHEDDHDNLTYARVERWDATAPLSVQVTTNAYTNDTTAWRLGRLTQTDVETSRVCAVDEEEDTVECTDWKSRSSSFGYDLAGPKTGLLNQEKVQPGGSADEELRTLHTLDGWGNRTESYTCSRYEADGSTLTDTECKTKTRVRHHPTGDPGLITAVHRYSRTTFDAVGRYATSSILPYYAVPGSTDVIERTASTINNRDEFGNATQVTDINGRIAKSTAGALGRPYHSDDGAGATRTTTYRWCTAVSCPPGAVFRSKTVSSKSGSQQLAPTTWAYHDRLGRPILTATEAFAAYTTGEDFSAVCTYYDSKTRAERTSDPAFLTEAAVGGEPSFGTTEDPVDPCVAVNWNRTERDLLGRTTKTVLPDGNASTLSYAGLETHAIDPLSSSTWELKNALGEVVKVTQSSPTSGSTKGLAVDYAYTPQGQLDTITRNAGQGTIVTSYSYDTLGRRTGTIDPDRGTETVYYNAAGEVIRTIDGQGFDVRLDIDAMGRVWRRHSGKAASGTEPPAQQIFGDSFEQADIMAPGLEVDTWLYDTLTYGRGQLTFEERVSPSEATYRRAFTYDNRGRMATRATLIDGSTYNESFAYDTLGRAYQHSDASTAPNTVETTYTNRGYPDTLRNATTTSEVYQDVSGMNARGQVTNEQRGPVSVTRGYHPTRGWLTSLQAGPSNTIQNLAYIHNALGNVTQRQDLRSNQTEVPAYDSLHRLKTLTATVGANSPQVVLNVTYDALGNICTKAGQTYTYAGRDGCNATGTVATASPHAVTQIGSTTYRYTPGGLLDAAEVAGQPSQNRYFAFDGLQNLALAVVGNLVAPTAEVEFRYGPGGERFLRRETVSGNTTITRTIGNVERITRPNGVIETKRYLAGVLIETRYSNTTPTTKRTLLPDGLGSMDTVVTEGGAAHERLSFDGHGTRRTAIDWRVPLASYTPTNTTDGFTGHEHADPVGLIHMNGRVYDPKMGRFIQADPMTDAGIQGLNRYSYVLNNPLSLTDPSGHLSDRWEQALRTVVAIAITVYSGGAATSAATAWGAAGWTVTGGFAAGAVQSGTLKGGLYGAFAAGLFFGIGTAYQSVADVGAVGTVGKTGLTSTQLVGKTVMHGIAGGVMSDLQGGKFGHGFVSAGVAQAVSPQIDGIDAGNAGFSARRVIAAAALGGTVSAATGGKFANGAVTAAFSRTFNDEIDHANGNDESLAFDAQVDENFINPAEEFDAYMNGKLLSAEGGLPEGHLTILAHGGGGGLLFDSRPTVITGAHRWDGEKTSRFLMDKYGNLKPGMTVVIASCYTGSAHHPGYRVNLAQYVASRLNVNVVSPTGQLTIASGQVIAITNHDGSKGTWQTFYPEK